jgi:hypothetical protein
VLIHTDEPMIIPDLLQAAAAALDAAPAAIDEAYVLMSYQPGRVDFPDSRPVIELPLRQLGGRHAGDRYPAGPRPSRHRTWRDLAPVSAGLDRPISFPA